MAKKSGKRSRSSTWRSAPAPPPSYELDEATKGDRIEIFYAKENKFYGAKVIAVKEADSDKPRRLKYIYDGYNKPSAARWISVADTKVRYETTEENNEEHHKAAFTSAAGHLEDDLWEVEEVVGERGEGEGKEYLVRWAPPWTAADDSWEPAESVGSSLISEFEAERDRERLDAEAEARRVRAPFVADTVERLRKKLRQKVENSKKAQPEGTIVRMEMGEEWKLLGLYEHVCREEVWRDSPDGGGAQPPARDRAAAAGDRSCRVRHAVSAAARRMLSACTVGPPVSIPRRE